MCPVVSGIRTKDTTLSCELGTRALTLALGEIRFTATKKAFDRSLEAEDDPVYLEPDACEGMLQSGGNLVIKLLECEESQGITINSQIAA